MLKKTLAYVLIASLTTTQLTACGFALRGYNTPISQYTPHTQLVFGNAPEDIAVKNALKQQFSQFVINTEDVTADKVLPTIASIQVSNIRLQTYQLRGILTEIRLVMSADVRYHVLQNGSPKTLTNTIQVQRSYQYDQATVATDNPQAEQIKVWLYDNLAQRIADQYMALNLPNAKASSPVVQP